MASLSSRSYHEPGSIVIRPLPGSRGSSPSHQMHRVCTTPTLNMASLYMDPTANSYIGKTDYIRWMKEPSVSLGVNIYESSPQGFSGTPTSTIYGHGVTQYSPMLGARPLDAKSTTSANTSVSSHRAQQKESSFFKSADTPSFGYQNTFSQPTRPSISGRFELASKESPIKISSQGLGRPVERISINYQGNQIRDSSSPIPSRIAQPVSFSNYFTAPSTNETRMASLSPSRSQADIGIINTNRGQSAQPLIQGSPFHTERPSFFLPTTPSKPSAYLGPLTSPLRKTSSVQSISPVSNGHLNAGTTSVLGTPSARDSILSQRDSVSSSVNRFTAQGLPSSSTTPRPSFSSASPMMPGTPVVPKGRDSFLFESVLRQTDSFVHSSESKYDPPSFAKVSILSPTKVRCSPVLEGESIFKMLYQATPMSMGASHLPLWNDFISASLDQWRVTQEPRLPNTRQRKSETTQPKPQFSQASKHKFMLVLDIDETLLHAEDVQINNRTMLDNARKQYDFKCNFTNPNGTKDIYGIRLRPYAREFLQEMSQHLDLALYTASDSEYAKIVTDNLDPERVLFRAVLSREFCEKRTTASIKNMDLFGTKDVLLVDNLIYSFCDHMKNGIPIRAFIDDADDRELVHLSKLLPQIYEYQSVEEFLNKVIHLDQFYALLEDKSGHQDSSLQERKSYLPQKVCEGHICKVTR